MSFFIGGYPGRGVQNMPPYHQNYGMHQPGAGGHGQYPARPMPNHVPHSQYPGFQVNIEFTRKLKYCVF